MQLLKVLLECMISICAIRLTSITRVDSDTILSGGWLRFVLATAALDGPFSIIIVAGNWES